MSARPFRICLVEDDRIVGEALADRLQLEHYECEWFQTGHEAQQAIGRRSFDVVICDIQLPDITGEELFVALKNSEIDLPPFIFATAFGTVDRAVRLLKLGAHDYLTKPLNVRNLLDAVHDLCVRRRDRHDADTLGVSGAMRAIEALLPRLARNPVSVLITGESGVGKEWAARALHRAGDPECRTPFVAVNCGALTESLLEAELFGHVKGSFTGAARDKKGVFELAHGGMLFLDEIGEMSPTMQVKLLRAIQERQIVRVGGETPIPVEIQLVCATHQDLKKMVEAGRFREDLYYRIHVVELHIPPLRERKEDILWLTRRLLDDWAAKNGDPRTLKRSAEKALLDYPWPGNIRELKHCLERACVLSQQATLTAELLFGDVPTAPAIDNSETLNEYLVTCERSYIEARLQANGGRIIETAAALGISRKNLWEKMKKLQIREKAEEGPEDGAGAPNLNELG